MAITTGAQLAAAIEAEVDRKDLSSRIPDFVVQAEAAMFRILRTPEMETKDAAFSITGEYVAVPTGFLEVRQWNLNSAGADYRPLSYLSPDIESFKMANGSGIPTYFSIVGSNFRFSPVPDGTYASTLVYWKAPTTVSTGASEQNWLLTANPDIYVAGGMMYASRAAKNWDDADRYKDEFVVMLGQIRSQGRRMRWGGNSMTARPG